VREVVCGHELPAQWQSYSLKTQQEMAAGRKSVQAETLAAWADDGELWLKSQFGYKHDLEFHTKWDTEALTITLEVFRKVLIPSPDRRVKPHNEFQFLFRETCAAQNFVNRLMVTKIMMVM
jgi:hypothetical protein